MDIDKIVAIANDPKVIKKCEPNVAFHLMVQKWMVVRTLEAAKESKKK